MFATFKYQSKLNATLKTKYKKKFMNLKLPNWQKKQIKSTLTNSYKKDFHLCRTLPE